MHSSISQRLKKYSLFFEGRPSLDQIFFGAFYICVGLLPPLLGIFGHKLVHLPLIVISLLIILRLFMRPQCRERMSAGLSLPATRLAMALTLLVAFYALGDVLAHPDRLRLLGKPIILFLASVLLVFIWTHRDLLQRDMLYRWSIAGVVAGLLVTGAKIVTAHALGPGQRREIDFWANFLKLDTAINDELKVISVLVFCAVAVLAVSYKKKLALLLVLLTSLLFLSFNVAGYNFHGGQAVLASGVYSETVQFGLVLAVVVLAFSSMAPKIMTHLLFAGMAFLLLNSPWLFQIWLRLVEAVPLPRIEIVLVRAEIWDGVASKILEAPFFGYGLDSVRYLQNIDLANNYIIRDDIWHPHNMFLQLWLDMGAIGVALVLGLFYMSWRFISRLRPLERPIVLAGCFMLIFMALVSHSVWQTWSMALMTFFIAQLAFLMPVGDQQGAFDKKGTVA